MQSSGCMWIEDPRKNNLQSNRAACGLKIQERTIFNPKKGTGGTDNKKHWEAVLTTCASARIQTIQTDYKAKLHRFRHLLMQIAWFVSFSNFPSAADGHILLNALDLFWPPKLSRREPAQYWPRGLVGKCLGCCRLLMHGGTQTIRFWGLQHVHWCEGSCCWFLRLQSRLVWDVPKALQGRQGMCGSLAGWFQVAIQAVDWFVPEHHLSIGLRCRFCEVHRRHLMHGGTQTIRFWGLQHVHWCEGSCCWFLRLQSRLVWDVPKALQGRQGMCGSLAGWFQVAIQAVDWFVPEHHLSIGLRCRFCEVHRRHLMHGGTQTIRFWGLQHVHWREGSCCWFLRLQSRLVWDVPKALQGRQGMCGSLAGWFQVAIQAVDWFVPEHHLSIGLRCRFCEVHRRHLMHGGTQTIRFWGLQHVHWREGSCCWFLRLQSRLVWEVAIQAVDWFVPEHHLSILV